MDRMQLPSNGQSWLVDDTFIQQWAAMASHWHTFSKKWTAIASRWHTIAQQRAVMKCRWHTIAQQRAAMKCQWHTIAQQMCALYSVIFFKNIFYFSDSSKNFW